jgi:taurine dioxygenase
MPPANAAHSWEVRRVAGALGAEVCGVDLARATADECEAISQLLTQHCVLFFPQQHLDKASHIRFGHFFGPLEGHPNASDISKGEVAAPRVPTTTTTTTTNELKEFPEIFELRASSGGVADEWHTDLSFLKEPAKMSILNMVRCPDVGGDTMWSSLSKAYDALSPPMKELCDGLTALHDAQPHGHPEQTMIHPVVRSHPVTGQKVLYVNEHFTRRIVEMNYEESDMLLRHLTKWVQRPTFTVRYRWSPGTIAMWDNSQTQHYVLQDFVGERIIQRVTIMGDRPQPASPNRWPPHIRDSDKISATVRHDRQLNTHLKATGTKWSASKL